MNRFLMSVAVLAAMSLTVEAAPKNGSGGNSSPHGNTHNVVHTTSHQVVHNHHQTHGIKANFGLFYRGRQHDHWTYRNWDPRYRCNLYWDPGVEVWFYYCVPDDCYYPVTYCPYNTYSW